MENKKKHPLLVVFIILGMIAIFLGVSMTIVLRVFGPSASLSFGEKIGVIQIEGTILTSLGITSQLEEFKMDKKIKAVIIRIDSPGGSVGPTQEIYREIQKTRQDKKVIASLGGVAASGGYYIASAADKIVANPGTITGSIGVLMEFIRFEDLLKKMGVNLEVLKSGEYKDIGSPHRKLTQRDRKIIETLMKDIQRQFVQDVAKGRNLSLEKVEEIADGRIFSGGRAKDLGMVDVLGNFQDAVEVTKEMADIKGDVTLVYPKKRPLPFWDIFLESVTKAVVRTLQGMKTKIEYRWDGMWGLGSTKSY